MYPRSSGGLGIVIPPWTDHFAESKDVIRSASPNQASFGQTSETDEHARGLVSVTLGRPVHRLLERLGNCFQRFTDTDNPAFRPQPGSLEDPRIETPGSHRSPKYARCFVIELSISQGVLLHEGSRTAGLRNRVSSESARTEPGTPDVNRH